MKFNFKKKYGQNFLKNKDIIKKISTLINVGNKDLIIEIGVGAGALTEELIKKDSYYIGYEIDLDLKDYLSKFINKKSEIIFDDFIKRNINEDIKNIKYDNLYIIGNLPYYITTPIILKIINENIEAKEMIFMVQKEVADRFTAKEGTKNYGAISVLLNYYYELNEEFVVKKENFIPIPKVDSAIITLKEKNKEELDLVFFNRLIKDSFKFKRKTLNNNLKNYDKEKINKILDEHGYSLQNRAEDIPYNVYVDITNKY